MPQSKEVHKEYMRVHRKGAKGSQNTEVHSDGSQDNVTQYPAILCALADVEKREKLRRICESLKDHGVLKTESQF